MDIGKIGMQYLNQTHVPFGAAPAAGEAGGFEEVLKRAQNAAEKKPAAAPADSRSSPLSKKAPIDKTDKLYEACMELETFLIKNLIKSMRSTVQKSNLIDTGFAGGIYEDMLYDEYSKVYAKNANFGFAEMAYRQLTGLK